MASALLSAALIVRNEERFLEGCLRSLEGRVDEIVVVDTGSTDRSREIARDLGARVLAHEWKDDFAVARNASIAAARGKWILYIDADERVVDFDRASVERLLSDRRKICYTVLFRPTTGYTRYREYRLFRNRPDLRFQGVIHESIVPALEALCWRKRLEIGDSPVALDHLCYDGDLEHKHERNLPLLRARLERDPGHVYCWDELGLTLAGLGDEAGAEAAWRRAIELVRGSRSRTLVASLPYLHLVQLLLDAKRDAASARRRPTPVSENHFVTWLAGARLSRAAITPRCRCRSSRLAAIDATRSVPPARYDA